jgi:hypothetical protein
MKTKRTSHKTTNKRSKSKRTAPRQKVPEGLAVESVRVTVRGEPWFQQLAQKIFTMSDEELDRRAEHPEQIDPAERELVAKGIEDAFASAASPTPGKKRTVAVVYQRRSGPRSVKRKKRK